MWEKQYQKKIIIQSKARVFSKHLKHVWRERVGYFNQHFFVHELYKKGLDKATDHIFSVCVCVGIQNVTVTALSGNFTCIVKTQNATRAKLMLKSFCGVSGFNFSFNRPVGTCQPQRLRVICAGFSSSSGNFSIACLLSYTVYLEVMVKEGAITSACPSVSHTYAHLQETATHTVAGGKG